MIPVADVFEGSQCLTALARSLKTHHYVIRTILVENGWPYQQVGPAIGVSRDVAHLISERFRARHASFHRATRAAHLEV